MALRQIVKIGDDVLRKKSRPITDFNQKLHTLLDDMKETLAKAEGAGLAAPQVGMLRRVVVIDVRDNHGVIELVNPEIVSAEGVQCGTEGCLSLPGIAEDVKRVEHIRLLWTDPDGNDHEEEISGFLARIVQHECDHLKGKLI